MYTLHLCIWVVLILYTSMYTFTHIHIPRSQWNNSWQQLLLTYNIVSDGRKCQQTVIKAWYKKKMVEWKVCERRTQCWRWRRWGEGDGSTRNLTWQQHWSWRTMRWVDASSFLIYRCCSPFTYSRTHTFTHMKRETRETMQLGQQVRCKDNTDINFNKVV